MKKTLLALAIGSILVAPNASANSVEDRLAAMEKRIADLEQHVQSQNEVIKEKDAKIAEMSTTKTVGDKWFNKIEMNGLVEVVAGHSSASGSDDTSDLTAATVELGINGKVNDWIGAEVVAKYEEDTDNNGNLNIDTAKLNIADPASKWFVHAGQFTLPFGSFETHMVSDPITLDLGETGDSAIEFGFNHGNFGASAYVFQGDHSTEIDNYGLALNGEIAIEEASLTGHLGYMNNLGESDGIVDGGWMIAGNESAGWILSTSLTMNDFTLIGEYLAASEGFGDAGNEKPSAFNLEGAYHFTAGNKAATFAIAYQGSDDAENGNWGLDEKRTLAGFNVELMEGTSLGLEYAQSETYTGTETDTVTGKLAVEF